MTSVDPYAVLGVPRQASSAQIARARRRLAKRYHPDVVTASDAAARMRRVNQAWQILSNPLARADYDRRHPFGRSGRSDHWHVARAEAATPESSSRSPTWRATTAAGWAAPRPTAAPLRRVSPPTDRSARAEFENVGFRESGWAGLLAAVGMLLIIFLAAAAGNAST